MIRAGLFTAALASMLSCGGSDVQQCSRPDLPNCGLTGHTVVKWMFDHYPDWGFAMDSCVDFGVGKVHVDAVDANGTVVTSQQDDCGAGQVTFEGLPDGNYSMVVTPLDFGGAPLVSAPAMATVAAGTFGSNTDVTAYVPWTAWVGTFTGTFLFRLSWNGQSCDQATPPIKKQTLMLMSNGFAIHSHTDNGQGTDGGDSKPCRALDEAYPQSVTDLPFGPATLTVSGLDQNDQVVFEHEFDTFVGAGISNPTITYDLPSAPADAGVDAM